MESNDNTPKRSRRSILQGIAATGISAIGASQIVSASDRGLNDVTERGSPAFENEDLSRTVTIRTESTASYSFDVTGLVRAVDAPASALDGDAVSSDISGDRHKFTFSGDFTAFELDGDAEVTVDGEPFDVEGFPKHALSIIPYGSAEVDISASGAVQVDRGSLEHPNDRTVCGTVGRRTEISYAGELTYADIDGDVIVLKNGLPYRMEDLLPSPLPGELTVAGDGTLSVEVSGNAATESYYADAANGTVEAVGTPYGATARYDGRIEAIEHENGAIAEIVPESKNVVCSAPDDSAVEFTTGSTEAFIYEEEVYQEPTVTVEPGETERIKYFGDVTRISIESVDVTFDHHQYEDAAASARLQIGAEFERTEAYQRLAANADAKIRHDADGIYAASVDGPEDPVDLIVFKFADVDRGDEGGLSLSRAQASNKIRDASNIYQWRTDTGQIDKIEKDVLAVSGSPSIAAASLTTKTYDLDIPEVTTTDQVRTQGILPLPTIPWGDWIGDIYDGLKDVASDIQGVTADYLANAIDAANVAKDNITTAATKTGTKIVCNSVVAFQKLAAQFLDDKMMEVLWKTRLYGYSSLISLLGSGVFHAIGNENYVCGACITLIRLALDVGVCDISVGMFCGSAAMPTLGLAAVPCQVLLGAACSVAMSALGDARDLCSGDTFPSELSVC